MMREENAGASSQIAEVLYRSITVAYTVMNLVQETPGTSAETDTSKEFTPGSIGINFYPAIFQPIDRHIVWSIRGKMTKHSSRLKAAANRRIDVIEGDSVEMCLVICDFHVYFPLCKFFCIVSQVK